MRCSCVLPIGTPTSRSPTSQTILGRLAEPAIYLTSASLFPGPFISPFVSPFLSAIYSQEQVSIYITTLCRNPPPYSSSKKPSSYFTICCSDMARCRGYIFSWKYWLECYPPARKNSVYHILIKWLVFQPCFPKFQYHLAGFCITWMSVEIFVGSISWWDCVGLKGFAFEDNSYSMPIFSLPSQIVSTFTLAPFVRTCLT